ncbi:hypothetical protein B2904_orf2287 [Brachyspira pilosicoli B2904]|uniref:Uncharacterized protein n=1 Tax=Brachyspira pilosicoli B2904 TaxID=1133568 RepID=J9US00_BRAPL|nr:hypothetical protein B2904_orf2287 [Brachyspira pilosicoli B2904]
MIIKQNVIFNKTDKKDYYIYIDKKIIEVYLLHISKVLIIVSSMTLVLINAEYFIRMLNLILY